MAITLPNPFMAGTGVPIVVRGGWAGIHAMHGTNLGQALGGVGQVVPLERYAIEKDIYFINWEAAPLTVYLNAKPMRRIVAANVQYRWKEQKPMPERDTAAGSASSALTTFTVNNINMWVDRDVVCCLSPYAQGWIVTGGVNTATNQITVTWTHAPATPITPNTAIFKIGNAYYQHDFPINQPRTREVEYHNVYQSLYKYIAISEQALGGDYQLPIGGPWQKNLDAQKRDLLIEKEKTVNFGQQLLDQATGWSPAGFCEGLYSRCVTNRHSLQGNPLTRQLWDNYILALTINRTEKSNWRHFCSSRHLSQISNFSAGLEQTTTFQNQFGMYITRYKHPAGPIVELVNNPLYDQLGLYGLGITLRMEAEAVALIQHKSCPGTIRKDAVIPYRGTYIQAGYMDRFTFMVKDEEGHIGVLEDVGAAAGGL